MLIARDIIEIHDFLTSFECEELIQFSEAIGFEAADVQINSEERQLISDIRNNERVNYTSQDWANTWWSKLAIVELPIIGNKRAIGLSPHFRFYKYQSGQKFNMHRDGIQMVDGHQTFCTLLVYLNQGFVGGSTKFRQEDLEITPKTGTALLFKHRLWHQGTVLESGTKYVLRTDVVYES